uniref:ADP,ATP carrier protein n=1 Tax=Minutocellus polymorphus TaxID=265543 RepID=A0A7S0FQB6_9STRA|mmetsp:Transcript_3592/g.6248  ORF Transcript_3592/g.6248 Transcript_3592/m.6248 type:complete len:323 (+) Transcript_3592:108-1076(+)
MKIPPTLLFVVGVIPSALGSPSLSRPIFSVSPFGVRDNRPVLPVVSPRGGSALPSEPIFIEEVKDVSPLLSVDSTTDILVQIFGLVNAFHGVALGLLPDVGRSLLGSAMDEEDELAAYAEESVGCFALEYGITGYLAASGLTTPEMAIGYGTLFDLYFLSKNLVNGKFASFGVQNLMYVMTAISAAGTYGVLADKLHLGPVLEMLTVIPAVQGIMKYFDPVGSGKRMLGADLSDNPVATALYRTSGQMKLVSAVLRGGIAFGVAPLRALSYSVFTSSALMMDSIFVKKTHEVVGKGNKALFHQLGSLALSLVMGTVFFLSEE